MIRIRIKKAALTFFFLSVVLCLLLFHGVFASAATYYVDIDKGLDTNAGTSASPWKTLHYSLSSQGAGTTGSYTLHVAAGTYSIAKGEADTAINLSGSDITIIGDGYASINANGPTAVIEGATNAVNWKDGIQVIGNNFAIKGIAITKFLASGGEAPADGYGILMEPETPSGIEVAGCNLYGNDTGLEIKNSTNLKIHNCKIYENTNDGLNIDSSSGEVYRNTIYKNGDDGIAVIKCSPAIKRNKIYDNDTGIRVEAIYGGTASPDIRNNVIYETENYSMAYGILVRAGGYASESSSEASPFIYHNSIDGGSGDGIAIEYVTGGSSTTLAPVIKYNIITHFDRYGITGITDNNCGDAVLDYNDVWDNGAPYHACSAGASDISLDPENGQAGPLESTSPCINKIPSSGDPVTLDYPGFTRPRPGKTTKDMGAYEYVADVTNNYTLPGGTGVATDYRIFTVPLSLGTGADMLKDMENVLGTYDPVHWRGFAFKDSSYHEFYDPEDDTFEKLSIKPGMGFWIITTYTDQIPFKGQPAPDGVDYVMDLDPGWHLIGLPWAGTQIALENIDVTDGVYTYALTNGDNNLTQRYVWDYTASVGYVKQEDPAFLLAYNTGYFLKVLSGQSVRLIIPRTNPRTNNQGQDAPVDVPPNSTNTDEDDEAPPPPPGAEPIPDIKVNGQDGPVVVKAGDSVSVSVSLDPGAWNGRNADWWVAAHTPFDYPLDWYTYVHPEGWRYGIHVCLQTPLFELMSAFPYNVLDTVLPTGHYIFYFAVDGNMDGETDATWLDYVEVNVQ